MFQVLTVAREYGSGGANIARKISERLGWKLLDRALMEAVARAAQVDPELARQYDERMDSWMHRVSRQGLWRGAFEGVPALNDAEVFDCETMTALTRSLIEEAYAGGKCVIVGRAGQCILQERQDVFHAFVYAPWAERVARIRKRVPEGTDIESLIRSTDRQRAGHIRMHFGCNWADPHLYHMLISSELGEDAAASAILAALRQE
jgi:cytidylate kinase